MLGTEFNTVERGAQAALFIVTVPDNALIGESIVVSQGLVDEQTHARS